MASPPLWQFHLTRPPARRRDFRESLCHRMIEPKSPLGDRSHWLVMLLLLGTFHLVQFENGHVGNLSALRGCDDEAGWRDRCLDWCEQEGYTDSREHCRKSCETCTGKAMFAEPAASGLLSNHTLLGLAANPSKVKWDQA